MNILRMSYHKYLTEDVLNEDLHPINQPSPHHHPVESPHHQKMDLEMRILLKKKKKKRKIHFYGGIYDLRSGSR